MRRRQHDQWRWLLVGLQDRDVLSDDAADGANGHALRQRPRDVERRAARSGVSLGRDRGDLPRQLLLRLARLDGLHRDHRREVTVDLDLALEERLDTGRGIALDKDLAG